MDAHWTLSFLSRYSLRQQYFCIRSYQQPMHNIESSYGSVVGRQRSGYAFQAPDKFAPRASPLQGGALSLKQARRHVDQIAPKVNNCAAICPFDVLFTSSSLEFGILPTKHLGSGSDFGLLRSRLVKDAWDDKSYIGAITYLLYTSRASTTAKMFCYQEEYAWCILYNFMHDRRCVDMCQNCIASS